MVRYELDTGTRHFGRFGTPIKMPRIPVQYTLQNTTLHIPMGYCRYLTNSVDKHTSDLTVLGSFSVTMVDLAMGDTMA